MTLQRCQELITETSAVLTTPGLSQEWKDSYAKRLDFLLHVRARLERANA